MLCEKIKSDLPQVSGKSGQDIDSGVWLFTNHPSKLALNSLLLQAKNIDTLWRKWLSL